MWKVEYTKRFLKELSRLPIGDYRIGITSDNRHRLIICQPSLFDRNLQVQCLKARQPPSAINPNPSNSR